MRSEEYIFSAVWFLNGSCLELIGTCVIYERPLEVCAVGAEHHDGLPSTAASCRWEHDLSSWS